MKEQWRDVVNYEGFYQVILNIRGCYERTMARCREL